MVAKYSGTDNVAGLSAGVFFLFFYIVLFVPFPEFFTVSLLTYAATAAVSMQILMFTVLKFSRHISALEEWPSRSWSYTCAQSLLHKQHQPLLLKLVGNTILFS